MYTYIHIVTGQDKKKINKINNKIKRKKTKIQKKNKKK